MRKGEKHRQYPLLNGMMPIRSGSFLLFEPFFYEIEELILMIDDLHCFLEQLDGVCSKLLVHGLQARFLQYDLDQTCCGYCKVVEISHALYGSCARG